MTTQYHLILGSQSPRRAELLRQMGLDFEVMPLNTDESYPDSIAPKDVAKYIANKKANAVNMASLADNSLLITCDTVVLVGATILGKPHSIRQARTMLEQLSNNKHSVISGVCLRTKHQTVSFSDRTDVWFKALSYSEIDYYTQHYQTLDKAGAYGIQDWIGLIGVRRIGGSFYNVMGLPTQKLYDHIVQLDRSNVTAKR
ncbi:Maf-like protein [Bacteroidia bacterium]|nr:Maf-like protein [Bacteroidia bacterium]